MEPLLGRQLGIPPYSIIPDPPIHQTRPSDVKPKPIMQAHSRIDRDLALNGVAFENWFAEDPMQDDYVLALASLKQPAQEARGFKADDPNLYRYVGNDATNLTDPSGLAPPPTPPRDGRREDPPNKSEPKQAAPLMEVFNPPQDGRRERPLAPPPRTRGQDLERINYRRVKAGDINILLYTDGTLDVGDEGSFLDAVRVTQIRARQFYREVDALQRKRQETRQDVISREDARFGSLEAKLASAFSDNNTPLTNAELRRVVEVARNVNDAFDKAARSPADALAFKLTRDPNPDPGIFANANYVFGHVQMWKRFWQNPQKEPTDLTSRTDTIYHELTHLTSRTVDDGDKATDIALHFESALNLIAP